MNDRSEKVDFDAYASRYESLVADQVGFFAERAYFSEYKVQLLKRYISAPASILDFGCGVGLSLPYFKRNFPGSAIFATDLSTLSLEMVRDNYSYAHPLADSEVESHRYDVVFLSCVIHHVHPSERPALFARISRLLTPGGALAVFEHNPYNPITRRLVSTCEFDADAQLITRGRLSSLIEATSPLKVWSSGYTLFVPNQLAMARPIERYIQWLPMGGQYFVFAR